MNGGFTLGESSLITLPYVGNCVLTSVLAIGYCLRCFFMCVQQMPNAVGNSGLWN